MKYFILALKFLTAVPVRGGFSEDDVTGDDLRRSMALFPLVGAVLGIVLVSTDYLLMKFLPTVVVSALLPAVLVVLTGCLHIDGFADTLDGITGGSTPETRLRIMRDSATGVAGVVGLVLLLLLKFSCIVSLPPPLRAAALLTFPIAARWSMTALSFFTDAVDASGLGSIFARNSKRVFVLSTLIAVPFIFLLPPLTAIAAIVVVATIVWLVTVYFKRTLGGVTGDIFGFQNELVEVSFLLIIVSIG